MPNNFIWLGEKKAKLYGNKEKESGQEKEGYKEKEKIISFSKETKNP